MDAWSFLAGLVVGALGAFFTGFMTEAGRDAYARLRGKLEPEPPDDVEVPHNYQQTQYAMESCIWSPPSKIAEREFEAYTYCAHPSNGGRTYRVEPNGRHYLMVEPGTEKL